jgi:Family of unknown function (DUF6499)
VVAGAAASPLIGPLSKVKQQQQAPYATYDLDDWQWEFLRRNPRYLKAYKAIEWLRKRPDKNTPRFHRGFFKALGVHCSFSWIKTVTEYEDWRYDYEGWRYDAYTNDVASGLLYLPSPDSTAREYKERLLKKAGAVFEIDKSMQGEGPWDFWTPFQLKEHEIALMIDTRYGLSEIASELKEILEIRKDNQRHYVRLYPDYLAVWDLRKEGLTDTQIAQKLWPDKYEKNGGRDSEGYKGYLIQRIYDYKDAADKLIENSFPPKTRSKKSRNKPPS